MSATVKNLAMVIHNLMPLDYLKNAAECLKCAAHPHRLRIIEILFQGKFIVVDIANLCELSQPATSGHLRLMEAKGLLKSERYGRIVYYSVAEPRLKGIIDCVRGRYLDQQDSD
jgi:ArsR family transcriptional regulator, zinc-responsive transcriptional repressor